MPYSVRMDNKLTPDMTSYFLLRALDGKGKPQTYTEVKKDIEGRLQFFSPEELAAGKLRLDPAWQMAINSGDIHCELGGYVVTDKGRIQLAAISDRLELRNERR